MATTKSTGRKIVWFFGAGASRGAGAYTTAQKKGKVLVPVQADFWSTVLKYANKNDRNVIESFLFHYFKMYSKTPPKLSHPQRAKLLNNINVEEVFTFLTERMGTDSISASMRSYFGTTVWPCLIRSVSKTFAKFTDNKETRRVFRDFSRNLLKSRDAIVSFNYDVVLENSLPNSRGWYYAPSTENGIPIFKPHGSINWQLRRNRTIKFRKSPTDSPVIIAPSHLKFVSLHDNPNEPRIGLFNQSNEITRVWQQMEKEMRESKALVFVGYSFPDADLYFSSVLRSVFESVEKDIPIFLVNPDAMRLSEKIRERFAVEPKSIHNFFDVRSFCRSTRAEILAA